MSTRRAREISFRTLRYNRQTTGPALSTGARYPLSWTISVPGLALHLDEHTRLNDQELASQNRFTPTYWEGAVEYAGTMRQKPVKGVGYLEMTGYDGRAPL